MFGQSYLHGLTIDGTLGKWAARSHGALTSARGWVVTNVPTDIVATWGK